MAVGGVGRVVHLADGAVALAAAIFLMVVFTIVGVALLILAALWTPLTRRPKVPLRPISRKSFVGNCWWWAVWRRLRCGGYLVIGNSVHGRLWHVMWAPTRLGPWYEFAPTRPRKGWWTIAHALLHRGVVRRTG